MSTRRPAAGGALARAHLPRKLLKRRGIPPVEVELPVAKVCELAEAVQDTLEYNEEHDQREKAQRQQKVQHRLYDSQSPSARAQQPRTSHFCVRTQTRTHTSNGCRCAAPRSTGMITSDWIISPTAQNPVASTAYATAAQ
jgi:hypothetical protein